MPETTRVFDDPDDEDRLYDELERRRSLSARHRAQASPQVAAGVGSLHANYPSVPAGVKLSLAKAGRVDPMSDVVRRVADHVYRNWDTRPDVEAAEMDRIAGMSKTDIVAAVEDGTLDAEVVRRYVMAKFGDDFAAIERINRVGKGAVRTGFTAFQSGGEVVAAKFRTAVRVAGDVVDDPSTILERPLDVLTAGQPSVVSPNELRQTTAAVATEQAMSGEGVDLGAGFLPGGSALEEQARRARAAGTIDGHAITPGRFLANVVSEPGSTPYKVLSGLVDAALAIKGDPGALGLGASGKARASAKTFRATGLVDGTRQTVLSDVADEWMVGEGRQVMQELTRRNDFQDVWELTNRKLPAPIAAQVAEATTEAEVMDILRPHLGTTIREKPTVGGFGVEVRRSLANVRLAQQMPGTHILIDGIEDPIQRVSVLDEAVGQLDAFQRNAKLAPDVVAANNARLARATSRIEAYRVVADVMGETRGALAQHGLKPVDARKLTRMFDDSIEDLRRYFVDEIGENAHVPGVVVDGGGKALPSPHLFVEYIDRTIPLPNARDIRHATSRLAKLLDVPGVSQSRAFLHWAMDSVWKPFALLRPAWAVRVVGEEQVRMGASGLEGLFSHPLSYLAWSAGRRGKKGLLGEAFDEEVDEFARVLSRGSAGWRDTDVIRTRHKVVLRRGDDQFARSWADELLQLRSDPIAQRVAGGWRPGDKVPDGLTGNHVDDAKRWFWDGPGKRFRTEMAEASGREAFLTREGADSYIDSVLRRIRIKAAERPDLMDAIATGKIDGASIREGQGLSKRFVDRLQALADEGAGPERVKGDLTVAVRGARSRYDQALETLFGLAMSKPTNALSRSPTFRQAYWRRVEELMGAMDEASQHQALVAAKEAGLSRPQLRRMAGEALRGRGDLALDDADTIAKAYGLDFTRDLLYDLHRRSQFFDAARLVFPFGEAWKEVLTRWAKLGTERPQTARRFQQVVQGARGAGFFYTSETSGEEVFAYPLTKEITAGLTGVPVPLEGRVAGLNIFSSTVFPGVGPVIQIPASHLIPNKPEWDWMRKIILPFGEVNTDEGLFESAVLPAWAKKFHTAITADKDTDRLFGNTVVDVMRFLKSTGRYPSTPEGNEQLLRDAERKARLLYAIRGAAQFVAPSAPAPKFLAEDKEGRFVTAQSVIDEFRRLQDEDYDTALPRFIERFGEDAVLFTQPKSRALVAGAPVTADGMRWAREHSALVKRFANTYGYFAPQTGEFDIVAYSRQFESGEREPVTPREAIRLANHRTAAMIYDAQRRRVGQRPSDEQRAWLGDLRAVLQREYPGFDEREMERVQPAAVIRELYRAVEDDTLVATDAGKGLRYYLAARDKALEAAKGLGLSGQPGELFTTARQARHLRLWLVQVADAIAAEHPDFAAMYDRVFAREVELRTDELLAEQEAA